MPALPQLEAHTLRFRLLTAMILVQERLLESFSSGFRQPEETDYSVSATLSAKEQVDYKLSDQNIQR